MKINIIYRASNRARTELHAGIFFCILYDINLIFRDNSKVEMYRTVTNAVAPMDSYDVDAINNMEEVGEYYYDKNGYLNIIFSEMGSKWIGRDVDNENMLVFQTSNTELNDRSSIVFILDK